MMATTYAAERRYFKTLRDNVSGVAKSEYEQGMKTLLGLYNTTIYENRFIVGGVVEVFTLALLRSVGISVGGYGDETAAGDLILPKNKMLSIKGTFTKGKSAVRLVNTMGGSVPTWTTATLFVVSGIGIVYGDPGMAKPADLTKTNDALMLKRNALNEFAKSAKNVIDLSIPFKAPKEMTRSSLKASMSVARQIMSEGHLKTLSSQISEKD